MYSLPQTFSEVNTMRALRILILAVIPFLLCSCGIIIGSVMTAGGGVDSIEVVSGDAAKFHSGKNLLMVAPFQLGDDGYYVSRGDDAANLVKAMNGAKLFNAKMLFGMDYDNLAAVTQKYKAMSAQKLQKAAKLESPPDYLLTATILSRDTIVAPMQGVMMEVSYRFELLELQTGEVLVVEVEAEDLFREVAPAIVEAVGELLEE